MLWYPDDFIDEVTARNDIVDIVREYLPLKASGRGYFGLCPFHNEKTASFHVSPERQTYHCFGCGEGGNVITFMMAIERMEFVEAVKFLGERSGIEPPEREYRQDQRKPSISRDTRQELYDINKTCARFYHKMLFTEDGKEALSYLQARGIDMQEIKVFGIGYAPNKWDSVLKLLEAKGYDKKNMLSAGLVVDNVDKGRVYDRFRNRLMFPIISPRDQVIGFGGRVMDDSLPKYLNTSDGPIFNKSATLYGLNLTKKIRPLEHLIIVEGYMDVIALRRFGFPQAVASLGTALTSDQARLMRRFTSDVFVAYDGDTAGQKASLRGLDILSESGYRVRVMQFPEGMDPDDVLNRYGPEYFKKLMSQSLGLIDYKIEQVKQGYDLDTPSGKVDFGTEVAKILAGVDNLIERESHVQRLESMTGIRSRVIYDQIQKIEASGGQKKLKRNISG
ncbi:MAG TPA: DNA primase, partial [Bacillota bacterium]|nr:DNA primase [Bacillota bacterium]